MCKSDIACIQNIYYFCDQILICFLSILFNAQLITSTQNIGSVRYMQDKLRLRTSPDKKNASTLIFDAEANAALKTEIQAAVKTSSKQLDDWMHMMKHKDGATDGSKVLFDFYEEMRKAYKKPPLYWMK